MRSDSNTAKYLDRPYYMIAFETKNMGGKYKFILTTHIYKRHIHHQIFNVINFTGLKHYILPFQYISNSSLFFIHR